MKRIKWNYLLTTSLVCLLPILLGLALWNQLPDLVPIHFNFQGQPDNFASKPVAVFALPFMLVVLQAVCCLACDLNPEKYGGKVKLECVTKWIIPIVSLILHPVTFAYALGWEIDIRKVAVFIVGAVLIATGNYLPKFDQVNGFKISADKARRINRFVGYETVIMGILMLLSMFFPPIASVIALLLLIPYTLIAIIYSIIIGTKKDGVE